MAKKSRTRTAPEPRRRRRLSGRLGRAAVTVLGAIALETVYMKKRGYPVGLKTVVRCRAGHLFTTIWIPGASVKAVRLGAVRLQYCPVGRHFTAVRPVKEDELTEEIRQAAELSYDARIP